MISIFLAVLFHEECTSQRVCRWSAALVSSISIPQTVLALWGSQLFVRVRKGPLTFGGSRWDPSWDPSCEKCECP